MAGAGRQPVPRGMRRRPANAASRCGLLAALAELYAPVASTTGDEALAERERLHRSANCGRQACLPLEQVR